MNKGDGNNWNPKKPTKVGFFNIYILLFQYKLASIDKIIKLY
jgi:hypothetical protein